MRLPIGSSGSLTTLIDDSDYPLVSQYRWYPLTNSRPGYTQRVYVFARTPHGLLGLHRLLMGLPVGDPRHVDHIDRNPLNNSRSNLRLSTPQQNSGNVPPRNSRKTSRYKGVSLKRSHRTKPWQATIGSWHTKQRWLGNFPTEEEAALAYNLAAIRRYGVEYAWLNDLPVPQDIWDQC